ncbi:hypothetical protein EV213_104138 [Aureibacillus halotolerans]|uniref:Uncharacterized protein n=1 Tax=Aureibacillus halotolerans TaxID=1508390 RepID=A0A4R6U3Z0_9BACI|nr:hypothetical protein EV213_104138 [Aureibacillus halotolerans]
MPTTVKKYSISFVNLMSTLMVFSTSFLESGNALLITISFLLLVNGTCFSNEYLLIKHYQKNQHKKTNIGYAILVMVQVVFTVLLFVVFKFYF